MMTPLFDSNNKYTAAGEDLCVTVRPMVREQILMLIQRHGYTMRTVLGPAAHPSVDAATYNVCPKEFQALWIGEVFDYTLNELL